MPHSRHSLGNADVVCLERVQRQPEQESAGSKGPVGSVADAGNALLGEVVDDARPVEISRIQLYTAPWVILEANV
jgi:hypothetical protein